MNIRVSGTSSVGPSSGFRPGRRLKLVANLPYSIATPVVANLLASSIVPATMTITIQKELADRIAAPEGSKDYGALSVWVQSQCRVELVRLLGPTVFWPRPKVTSAILQIEVYIRHQPRDLIRLNALDEPAGGSLKMVKRGNSAFVLQYRHRGASRLILHGLYMSGASRRNVRPAT